MPIRKFSPVPTLLAAAGTSLPLAVTADTEEQLHWSAIAESRVAFETNNDQIQKGELIFTPNLRADIGADQITASVRIRADFPDKLEPGEPEGQRYFRSPVSRRGFLGDTTDVELRELYWDTFVGNAMLRLGKQQIVWGQADGLRVLDQLNPFSLREFILPDFEDRRIPLWALNAEFPLGPLDTQLVWLPDHTYDDVPAAGSTFHITSPRQVPRPPQGFDGSVEQEAPDRPNRFGKDDDYGIRFSSFIGGWDLSANYLYHYRDQPVYFRHATASGILLAPEYVRSHLTGMTFSSVFGDLTFRGEIGYSTDRYFLTRDAEDLDGVVSSNETSYVLGLDYQRDADLLISGQFFQSVIDKYEAGLVRDRTDSRATLQVQRELMNDTLVLRSLAIHSLDDGDGLVQLDLEYSYRSNIILSLGLDHFYGDTDGLFGQFEEASRLTAGIEVGI